LFCSYSDDFLCECTACSAGPCGTMPTWNCTPPPADTRCPRQAPHLGTPCDVEGANCVYHGCTTGAQVLCMDGFWSEVQVACPAM
jgi:hypothetical protein